MLKYYDGNSGDVQLGVYARLRINEPAKAQVMLADYGFKDATVGEGVYQLRSSANSSLTATPGSSGLTLNTVTGGKNQQFRLDYHASGYYTITCQENGLRLTAGKNGVTLAKASTDKGQLWKAAVYNSGFSLQNRGTGTYLSVSSNAAGGRLVTAMSGPKDGDFVSSFMHYARPVEGGCEVRSWFFVGYNGSWPWPGPAGPWTARPIPR